MKWFTLCAMALPISCSAQISPQKKVKSSALGSPISASANIPVRREGTSYCSIPENGSTDTVLKDGGTMIATLGEICVNLNEVNIVEGPRRQIGHTIGSHLNTTVKSVERRINSITFSMSLDRAGSSTKIELARLANGQLIGAGCTTKAYPFIVDQVNQLGDNTPDILPYRASTATMYFQISYYKSC